MINKERWFKLSLAQQMGHIGSEITRARVWKDKSDVPTSDRCLERALDLIDLTKDDSRLFGRRREICYLREIVADQYIHSRTYHVSLEELEQYCLEFGLAARRDC